tara:strand:- start:214 stop:792 length:579 start_codon:yes stop_codon:yes gene_type:complete
MSDFTEKINLDDLYSTQKSIENNKLKIYQKILARVHKKIKTTGRSRNCEKFCFFLVPEFVLGIPRYDISTCISYIIDQLIDNGFQVRYTHPNLLFISWNHYIPYHTRMDIKKKHGVKIDGFGNIINNKKQENNDDDPNSLNSLIFKKNTKIPLTKNKKDKNYTQVSTYKPTGNLIYSNELLGKVVNSMKKDS